VWLGHSLKTLRLMPEAVQDVFGYGLYLAQVGRRHRLAKTLSGFGNAAVVELRYEFAGKAFRLAYTTSHPEEVHVLHVFVKKATRGVATLRADLRRIRGRLDLLQPRRGK